MRMDETLNTFGAKKVMFSGSSVSFGVKRHFHERIAVLTIACGEKTLGMRLDERHTEIKCLRSM